MVEFLRTKYFGQVEKSPVKNLKASNFHNKMAVPTQAKLIKASSDPVAICSAWLGRAVESIDKAINDLVLEFTKLPYKHRREHSIHCELFHKLASDPHFAPFDTGSFSTQPIHKEWPEYISRPEKGNQRGNFDMCIITPESFKGASLDDFINGRIKPSIVIEFGLDYGYDHLIGDMHKLDNSGIEHSYIVHLSRPEAQYYDYNKTEDLILSAPFKCAYARLDAVSTHYKLLGDKIITRFKR